MKVVLSKNNKTSIIRNAPQVAFDMLGSYVVAFLAIVCIAAVGYGGYVMGAKNSDGTVAVMFDQQSDQVKDNEKNAYLQKLNALKSNVNADMEAYSQRIGLLQAHINRLNALGARLAENNGISDSEFSFLEVPALGGDASESAQNAYESNEILDVLNQLEDELLRKEDELRALEDAMLVDHLEQATKPNATPVTDGWMSSGYGYRTDPLDGSRRFHGGVDYAVPVGTPVFSAGGGIVARSEFHKHYGNIVEIDHNNGYSTSYAHNSKNRVKVGDIVKKGQHIADAGSSGRSTGPHLHFEVKKNGERINPTKLVGVF